MQRAGIAAAQELSLFFGASWLAYWVFVVTLYLRRRPDELGDAASFVWHLFVPCRDEEAVVGQTVAYLRSTFPGAEVWVIDDDSNDATAQIVEEIFGGDGGVHVIRRRPPDARVGKGPALNAAYRALRAHLGPDAELDQVIVGVVDADGRPSPNCLAACAGPAYFADAQVGGVQVEVRIVNRDQPRPVPDRGWFANLLARTLVRMQDLEFRAVIGGVQASRGCTRTVGLGGNGQFTRLSSLVALDNGDGRAWRGSLIEDYELGLHLMLAGHRTAYCTRGWVDQEGLPSFRRFVIQRTRWGQGVMQCIRYLPTAWNSPAITTAGALETSYYLLQPWLNLLGTFVFSLPVVVLVATELSGGGNVQNLLGHGGWGVLVMFLVFGWGPFLTWGPLYRHRHEPSVGLAASVCWGALFPIYLYFFYLTSWRAFFRILRGQHGWSKTRRNAEFDVATTQRGHEAADLPAFSLPVVEFLPTSSTGNT